MRHEPVVILLSAALASLAQSQATPAVTIRGSVLDAASSLSISGAQLTLTAIVPSVLPTSGPSPIVASSRVATTDSAGNYEIRGVSPGDYQLLVRRLGYRHAVIGLDVGPDGSETRLSVGLLVVPVRLEPVLVDGQLTNMFGRLSDPADSNALTVLDAARARQMEFLGTDVRELTMRGTLEAGGVGETDILRALRRLPGVTGFDDQSAQLWVRGARWDQVRISFDGMPVFNPFVASGTMSGIGADAIGAAFLHPGVRPVSLLNQGASLVDLRSRAGSDTAGTWIADASRRAIGVAYDAARRDGRGGIAFSARQSSSGVIDDLPVPVSSADLLTDFSEMVLRVDRDLGSGRSLEASALRSRDHGNESFTGMPNRSGTMLARVTITNSGGPFRISHTGGYSGYDSDDVSGRYPLGVVDTSPPGSLSVPGGYSSRQSSVSYWTLRGDISPKDTKPSGRWNAGYQFFRYHTSSFGLRHTVSWSALSSEHFNLRRTRQFGALWAERRWTPLRSLTVDAGARLESSIDLFTPRVASSVQGRYRIDHATSLSIGAARLFQDAQELPFTSPSSVTHRGFWILSGRGYPTLRADQASIGMERWLGGTILLDVNGYARRLSHVAVPPLPAGDSTARPLFLSSQIDAKGVEIGVRKLAGSLTGSASYSYGKATERVEGVKVPASGDRPHAVDATAMWQVGRYRLGSAFTYMSGAPYTRMAIGQGIYVGPDSIEWSSLSRSDARNAQRLPAFVSIDAFVETKRKLGSATLTPYFGIQNLQGRRNLTATYAPYDATGDRYPGQDVRTPTLFGRRLNGGVRVVF